MFVRAWGRHHDPSRALVATAGARHQLDLLCLCHDETWMAALVIGSVTLRASTRGMAIPPRPSSLRRAFLLLITRFAPVLRGTVIAVVHTEL